MQNPTRISDTKAKFKRKRKIQRDLKNYMDLFVTSIVLSRRQYPVFKDRKFKTFAFSIGNVTLQCRDRVEQSDILGTPFASRHKNFYEMAITSEKDYAKNLELESVTLGLRPLSITVTPLPLKFV